MSKREEQGARRSGQNQEVIDVLDSFLEGEVTAVETYRHTVEQLEDCSSYPEVIEGLRSHEVRVDLLRHRIVELGGSPSRCSMAWRSLGAVDPEEVGALAGSAALEVLEVEEHQGWHDYERRFDELDWETRRFIQRVIRPEQRRIQTLLQMAQGTLDTAKRPIRRNHRS